MKMMISKYMSVFMAAFVVVFAFTAPIAAANVAKVDNTDAVAVIGGQGYKTFAEALTAANAMTGDVTVEICEKVTLNTSLSGSYSSITFVGKDTDAEIYLEVQGYITATGKTVNFQNLKLSKSQGGFITNAGFMNTAFGVYDVKAVNYTNCTFSNGAYASSGTVTFTKCIFKRSWDKYGLWAYGDVNCIVDECTFDDYRGIKMYAEGAAKTTELTVKNSNFLAVTDKPAIVLTYGESVNLEDNTYSSTGTFELDLDGAPNGVAVTSDVAPTCKNDAGACGVLVDGKIYTTVAQAAAVATSGSTVTLLHDSTETVELPEGVTLNKNNYAAAGVTVAQPVAKIGETTYATLEAAFAAATEGQTITLLMDAMPALTSQRAITKAAIVDLGSKTLTLTEDDLYFGTTTFKNGTIVVDPSVKPSTAVFWMFANQTLTFDAVKIVATGVTGTYLIGLDGDNADLNLLNGSEILVENTTALDLDIVCVNASTGNDIVIDNSKINVTNLDGKVLFRGNYTIKGNSEINLDGITKAGIRIEAGQTLSIEDTASVKIAGEPRDGGIHLTDVTATYTKADTATVTATVNRPAIAKIGDTPYYTLADAVAAAQASDEIILLADVTLDADLTLPAGIKFNGNGKTVAGTIKAGGNLEFVGNTIVSTFNPGWYNNVITIGAGASLKATSGRMTVSYGNTFNITGSIADGAAKTADKTTITPSLELVGGISFNGNGGGVNFNVLNAYVKLGDSTTKNSGATGEFNLNFTNSIVDFTKTLKTYMPTATGLAPAFKLNAVGSVIDFVSHLEFWLDNTTVALDATKVTVGGSFANAGTLALNNNSEFIVKAPIMSSHGGNTGTITVNSGTFELVDSNEAWQNAGTMTVGATGTLKLNDFKCVNEGVVSVDVTGMNVGTSIADRIVLNSANTDFVYSNIKTAGSGLLVVDDEGKLVERPLVGSGTEADPFVIASLADLELFRAKVNGGNSFAGKFVKMTADIDLGNAEWTPIAYMGKTFKGTFDGNGKTISNLKITKDLANAAANNGIGFFGRTDDTAVIKNLTIENVDITGSLYVGAIVGNGYTGKTVENCTVKGNITIDAWWYAGVIGGNGYMTTIKDCHIIGNEGSYIKGNNGSYIGGIWGFRGEGANSIVNCSVQNLEVIGVDRVGGIAGIGHYGNNVSTCSVKDVTITATDPDATTVGLIVGACQGTASEPSVFEDNVVAETVARVDNGDGTFKNVAGIYGTNINGSVPVTNFKASINGVPYMTLAAALSAAQNGDTVELLWAEGNAPIAMNGSVFGKSVTITGSATVDWSKGFLFVGRGGEGNGTVIFNNANLRSASNSASYGIHVSGREKNTNNKYDGTVVINNSTIELDYLIDKGVMTLDDSTLTVKNGFAVGGRPASETESGDDATATIGLSNGSRLVVNNHNGMGLGFEAIGIMNIDDTSSFECKQDFLVTAKGTMNVNGGDLKVAGTLTNKGTVNVTDTDLVDMIVEGPVNAFGTVNISGTSKVAGILSAGYYGSPDKQVVVNITGNFESGNVLVGSAHESKLNINDATAYFGQLGAFGDVEINNSTITYGYAFIRNDFTATNSSLAQTNGVNTYISGNAKVVLDNSQWTMGAYSNIGSYGGYMYGNADVALKNGSSITGINVGVERSGENTVKLSVDGTSSMKVTKLSFVAGTEFTSAGNVTGAITVADGANVSITGGTYSQDVTDWCAGDFKCVANGDGTFGVVAKIYVVQVGDIKYETIAEAVNAAQEGDVVTFLSDVEQKDGVLITDKKLTIDLNEKTYTVSEGASTNNRNFKINGSSEVTITNGTLVAKGELTSGAYGTVRTEGAAVANLIGLKLYSYRGYGLNVKACTGTTINIKDTEIYAQYSGGVESAGGTINLTNVKIEQTGVYSGAAWCSVAIGVNGGGKVVVNSGTYSAKTIASDANAAQGTWVAYVMSSGGTLEINDGTFNGVVAETATAANACGIICADSKAVVEINGGTFNSNGAILDMRNNTSATPNPTATLKGGTYSADPRVSGLYASNLIKVAEGYVVTENDGVYTVAKAVAKIGEDYYTTLEEAFKAATSGCTIEILADVTVDYKWDCRDYATGGSHSQFKEAVTINGNGHTLKFTGTVNDSNWNTIFRFEENATVNNLTVDISEATGAQRVISAKKSLTVNGLTIVGSAKYGIIFGEGASADDLAESEIVVTNSSLTGTRRAISDNENGKDVKSVVITGTTLKANVNVSAYDLVTFSNNTVEGGYVDIRSYTADAKLDVTATGNTLPANTEDKYNYVKASGALDVQSEFVLSPYGTLTNCYTSDSGYWGECGGNAKESFVFKFYNDDTYMGYTSLNNVGGIIDGSVYVSWNIRLDAASNTDEYWTMAWEVQPTLAMQPNRCEQWVDGVKVAECAVEPNWSDRIFPVVAAVTDEKGQILSYVNNTPGHMLKDAFAAGGNIVLLRDVELTETLKLPKGREINLDLNGFVIDGREKVRIAIMSYGDLTLKDSSAGKTGAVKAGVSSGDGKHGGNTVNVCAGTFTMLSGSIYSLNNAILIDKESAEVSIKGGTITAEPTTFNSAGMYISSELDTVVDITGGTMTGYNGILLWNNTKITMTGGSIDARGRLGIQGNGSYDNTELYISGNAEVRGADAAIYHPQGGILVIEDNAVLTGGTGIIVKGGNVTIAGGTISGTGEAVDYGPVGSGYNGTGDALYVEHFDNIPNSENYGTPVVAVTGGSFNSLNGKPIASYANPANESAGVAPLKQFVSGGMFNAQIEDSLCASGYECKDNNNDGVYGVVVVDVVAFVGWSSYKTFAAAVEAATNEVVRLAASATFSESLTVDRPLRIDLNGKTLTKGEGGLFTIDGAVVTIDGGGLSGFSNADITLAGNAILTVTDANVAASFRTDADYYVSQNANGTHSIMLKSAFRVFITVVDGEPRIGFFKDCDTEKAPTAYTVKGATNLETPEWTTVDCVDASDAAAASELPLHWVKPAAGSGFRFFKLSAE